MFFDVSTYILKKQVICITLCVISDFHSDVSDISAILGCYAACSSKALPTFRGKLSVPFSGAEIKEGIDKFS
jgi:hypothetical protein